MKDGKKGELNYDEREVADRVADEILDDDEKKDKRFLILLLLFILLLAFLVSGISFAIISGFYGSKNNIIDVGSVLFSFNEESNNIEIYNALPTLDSVGKSSTEDKHYLDFTVSVGFSKNHRTKKIGYQLLLLPMKDNSLNGKYIRVYLVENNSDVLINKKTVNNFSDLEDSKNFRGAKVLLKKHVTSDELNNYRLRLWLSDKYELTSKSETFRCKVAVEAYE